ncbi:hypothetical protein [Pseudomonas sp.]|uniref:hypothetical protein n=1 Tax=Pseudomonas sp. TaxID=306 RepID=UPI003FD8C515
MTNNSVYTRIKQQSLNTSYKPLEVIQISLNKGYEARKLEKEILSKFPRDASVTKEIFSDGYTEVLENKSFDEIKGILENYAKYY